MKHHGVLLGVQRGRNPSASVIRRDHRVRGPVLRLHHQDAAGREVHPRRPPARRRAPATRCKPVGARSARPRSSEIAGDPRWPTSNATRHRRRDAHHHRRDRPVHGRHRHRPDAPPARRPHRPADHITREGVHDAASEAQRGRSHHRPRWKICSPSMRLGAGRSRSEDRLLTPPPSRSPCASGAQTRRKADQMVRGTVNSAPRHHRARPPARWRSRRVPKADVEAQAAGLTTSAPDELIDKRRRRLDRLRRAAVATPDPDGQGRRARPCARPARSGCRTPKTRTVTHGRHQGRPTSRVARSSSASTSTSRTCTSSSARRISARRRWRTTTPPLPTRSCALAVGRQGPLHHYIRDLLRPWAP